VAETNSGTRLSIGRLILVPALITLAVTIVRLLGELNHLSKWFFNSAAGGPGALVGIAWLPFIFGPYFAVKLIKSGQAPARNGKAIGFAVGALVLTVAAGFVVGAPPASTPRLITGLLIMALAVGLEFPAWSALAKTLLAYAHTARIPVAIVMFFAMQGHWGTHYDALPPEVKGSADFWPIYVQFGLVPQLIGWITYTLVIGSLFGTIFAALAGRKKVAPQTA
jgi:hypothetical protein